MKKHFLPRKVIVKTRDKTSETLGVMVATLRGAKQFSGLFRDENVKVRCFHKLSVDLSRQAVRYKPKASFL